ncbi:MAG: hypothetical protein K6U74_00520 [Firmicutes bacterium]|nr:hypothetical protein [Bacillota bacterium]
MKKVWLVKEIVGITHYQMPIEFVIKIFDNQEKVIKYLENHFPKERRVSVVEMDVE